MNDDSSGAEAENRQPTGPAGWRIQPDRSTAAADSFSERSPPSGVHLPPEEHPPRGLTWLAWFVVVLVVGIHFATGFLLKEESREEQSIQKSGLQLIGQLQGKYLVGVNQLANRLGGDFQKAFHEQVKSTFSPSEGSVLQRLQALTVEGELSGGKAALESLHVIQSKIVLANHQVTAEETRLVKLLETVLGKIVAKKNPGNDLPPEDRDFLLRELGWCGKLVLVPENLSPPDQRQAVIRPAEGFALILLGGLFIGGAGFIFGLFAGVVLLLMFLFGVIRFKIPQLSKAGNAAASGVYVESFAVWLVSFQIGSLVLSTIPLGKLMLGGLVINMLGCLMIGLVWPVLRGIPWSVVRKDIGWTTGDGIFVEPVYGIFGYLTTLPLLAIGVLVMFVLMVAFGSLTPPTEPSDPFAPQSFPVHPIVGWVTEGDRMVLFQVAVLACVIAPFVEETMFRGFLYRHLRDASQKGGLVFSFLFSTFFNSLVFAAIHPQGLLGIPPLMAIACGLSILREWRGSLLGPMVAHGCNNSIVTALLIASVW